MNYSVKGFSAGAMHCGIKRKAKYDLAVIYSEVPAVAAGVFTKNKVKAAPVQLSKKNLKSGSVSALVFNSGNANACTGKDGVRVAGMMAGKTAEKLKLKPKNVLVCSTGVIGVKMPAEKIKNGLEALCGKLSPGKLVDAAQAMLTTDTFKKIILFKFRLNGRKCSILGMAKGSGMIHPNMATLLCFLLTDVSITRALLNKAFREGVEDSFNSITVDGDTSTNDTVLALANGMAGNKACLLYTSDAADE